MIAFVVAYWHWLAMALPVIAVLAVVARATRDWRLAAAAGALVAALLQGARVFQAGREAQSRDLEQANSAAARARDAADRTAAGKPRAELERDFERWGKPALLLGLLALGGCASLAGGGAGGAFCETARPIKLSAAARAGLSDAELRRLWAHNDFGERRCGARWVRQG
ncbi:hypothetical protein [Chelatococcus reniformis]|uniref:Uncharacterized protein n=1 Tax=Chelatococcus reniformis TaxID=1494448 RepID=A0A916X933_9HYPH|nr:hypothetical protein [Chelatococcus reniformis]GGC52472.1 hypothetical protein GCM10010994_09390 [Chelatococcus reniformis]